MATIANGTTVKLGKREFTVVGSTEIGADLPNLRDNMIERGLEPVHYFLEGKRGAQAMCQRGATSGEFIKLW